MLVSRMIVSVLLCVSVAHPGVAGTAVSEPALARASDLFTELDYAAAFAKAEAEDLLLLVDATAVWCGPCKRMDNDTWSNEKVIKALSGVALAFQFDVDESEDLRDQLQIKAMPTVLAIRGGKLVDRHVGYMGPTEFLEWFDSVRSGVNVAEEARAELLAKDAALLLSTDEVARYDQAEELAGCGEYDRALVHYLWLWENVADGSPLSGVRVSFMLSKMGRLAAQHPPAMKAFIAVQAAVYARVETEPTTLTWRDWTDWMALSRTFDDGRQVLAWFDEHKQPEGGLSADLVAPDLQRGLTDRLLDLLMATGQIKDAAGLGVDLVSRTSLSVAMYKSTSSHEVLDRLPEDTRAMLAEAGQTRLRKQLALYYTVARVAGETDDARKIAGRLLSLLDDADSRVVLVTTALESGDQHDPQLRLWLDEAAGLGEPVGVLRNRLERVGG